MKILGNDGKEYGTIAKAKEADAKLEKAKEDKEAEVARVKAEREGRAKEVKDAYENYMKAHEKYVELLSKFLDDYGSFHTTFTNKDLQGIRFPLFPDFFTKFW